MAWTLPLCRRLQLLGNCLHTAVEGEDSLEMVHVTTTGLGRALRRQPVRVHAPSAHPYTFDHFHFAQ